jgi:DNA-binding response OmpR family regulator
MSVLLVEPSVPLARAVLRGLEEEGIAAQLARDDTEADARVRAGGYRAVIVDWQVPRVGGVALVRSWRRAGLAVPVLLLLPSAAGADLAQGVDAGADAVLPLPFAFADLLARLRAWVQPSALSFT